MFAFVYQVLVPKVVFFTLVKRFSHVECSDKIHSVERFIKYRSVGHPLIHQHEDDAVGCGTVPI
jgi:hypothetical protein